MTANPQYADSGAYAGRFRQLQARALATVRSKVQQVLRYAAEQVGCCPEHLLSRILATTWGVMHPAECRSTAVHAASTGIDILGGIQCRSSTDLARLQLPLCMFRRCKYGPEDDH